MSDTSSTPQVQPNESQAMTSILNEDIDQNTLSMLSTNEIINRTKLIDNKIKILINNGLKLLYEYKSIKEKIKKNMKILRGKTALPHLVAVITEVLDFDSIQVDEKLEDGCDINLNSQGKCVVIRTSWRNTYFLPNTGLVEPHELTPGDLVGVDKDTFMIIKKLPPEYNSRAKAMEVQERPFENYTDIGGLYEQMEELFYAVIHPLQQANYFYNNIGIEAPKGVLFYGPPGTGKTLLARACAAQTQSTFFNLSGPQLVRMYIGEGAKLVRDVFAMAKEKQPSIIFIDELDGIGKKRLNTMKTGDREVMRTLLELINQLDGFQPTNNNIKVIAATNRIDMLDPSLLRSGRLDKKIEFPLPSEKARTEILKVHSRKMKVNANVNFKEVARCTDDFNGAQLKAVCVEAGMIALRREADDLTHEDYLQGVLEVKGKTKTHISYYA